MVVLFIGTCLYHAAVIVNFAALVIELSDFSPQRLRLPLELMDREFFLKVVFWFGC